MRCDPEHARRALMDRGFHPDSIRETTEFACLPLAHGAHLGAMDVSDSGAYRAAMRAALDLGVNFFDTALNYRGMRSVRDLGAVLRDELARGRDRREFVVSTKAGMLPGDIVEGLPPPRFIEERLLSPGVITPDEIHVHGKDRNTLAPAYFDFALGLNLEHLGLDAVDVYYLHNPEVSRAFLGAARFLAALPPLFAHLEAEVRDGRIGAYGMASWQAFQVPAEDPGHVELEEVLAAARDVAGEGHHFRYLQVPLSHARTEVAEAPTQRVAGAQVPTLEAARRLGLHVTLSSPLAGGRLEGVTATPGEQLHDLTRRPGVLAAMIGMRQVEHVRTNLEAVTGRSSEFGHWSGSPA